MKLKQSSFCYALHLFTFILLSNLALSTYAQGANYNYQDSLRFYFDTTLDISQKIDIASLLIIEYGYRDYEEAKRMLDSLEYYVEVRRHPDAKGILLAANAFYAYYVDDNLDWAMKQAYESIASFDNGTHLMKGCALYLQGMLLYKNYLFAESENKFNVVEQEFKKYDNPKFQADLHFARAKLQLINKNEAAVVQQFQKAADLHLSIRNYKDYLICLNNLVWKHSDINNFEEALKHYNSMQQVLEEGHVTSPRILNFAKSKMIKLYRSRGDTVTAARLNEEVLSYKEKLKLQVETPGYSIRGLWANRNLNYGNAEILNTANILKVEKQTLELKQLETENQLKQSRINFQITIITGAVLIGFGLIYYSRRLRAKNKVIEEQNEVISKALNDKEILLKEIHHRVKNNLQVISSLLGLQSLSITDQKAKDAIQEGRSRVHSMSLIHQNLYSKDNLTGIRMASYIHKLSNDLIQTYNTGQTQIALHDEVQNDLILDVETVVPLGLIINELVTNCLKYAFPNREKGLITIKLVEEDQQLVLSVADDGIGMKNETTQGDQESFGLSLIRAFKEKLDAELDIISQDGTIVTLRIKNYK